MRYAALTLVVAAFVAGAPTTRAQESSAPQEAPTLDRADELSRTGRTEEARDILTRWWSDRYDSASPRDVQRALWLRGRLTVDPAQAALDFQRLVIEYPGGPYSDRALFRLAQSAFAFGDSATAAGYVARLGREYPGSPVRRDAEAWLAAAGPPPPPVVTATTDSAAAPAEQEEHTEAAPTRGAPPAARGRYAIQLGAFASESRARALQSAVRDAGFDVRLARVRGSDLVRVRVGRFVSQDKAEAMLKRLEEQGFTATLVRNADREEGGGA